MKKLDLNLLPEQIKNGEITKQEALHKLAVFLQENSKIFLLKDFEKDLKTDVIIYLLEKGEKFLDKFDPSSGSFFNYFFCYIKSTVLSLKRKKKNMLHAEYHSVAESINTYQQKEDEWSKINYKISLVPKIPYNSKPVDIEAFQLACKSDKYRIKRYVENHQNEHYRLDTMLQKFSPIKTKKILLVLALKSAYYITDEEIHLISEICGIDYELLLSVIQYIKEQLTMREANKKQLELRRNNAWFQHSKCRNILSYLKNDIDLNSSYKIRIFESKYRKHTYSLDQMNRRFKKGIINIRPTNKMVAQILGICERQVSYYIRNVANL